ncbi:hypothetical protein ACI8AC_19380 [Geodermatophilus sp. SYSU D00758]
MRWAAPVLATALCAACASGSASSAPGASSAGASAGPPSSAAPALPAVPGIAGEVVRLRTDEAVGGQVQVKVTDTGDMPFTVTAVAIDSPGFTPLPPREVTAAFEPGQRISLPTPHGEPVCTIAPQPLAARLTVVRPDGAVEEVRVPLAGDDLDEVHAEMCAVAGVLAVATVTLEDLRDDGEVVTGRVVLTRAGDDDRAVTADRLTRSVLLDVAADGLPLRLAEGEERAATGVSFTLATCEPHVLAETKQPFLFPLRVVVEGEDAVPVPLPVDRSQQDAFWALVQRVC